MWTRMSDKMLYATVHGGTGALKLELHTGSFVFINFILIRAPKPSNDSCSIGIFLCLELSLPLERNLADTQTRWFKTS